jgi:hypothetical protein
MGALRRRDAVARTALIAPERADASRLGALMEDPSREEGGASREPGRLGAGLVLACVGWGLAEATLFFVIPDVLLTWIARRSRRRALWGCAFALVGALGGGSVMFRWSAGDHAAATATVDRVPFVPSAMIARVERDLEQGGAFAVIAGAWMGRPYKLYAVEAPEAGMSAAAFLAATVPARLLRFVAFVLVASAVARRVTLRWGARATTIVWAAVWIVNYAIYWSLMSI